MATLKHMARDGSFTLWDEHFKTILLLLIETLGDSDFEIRSQALRVLKEIWYVCFCFARMRERTNDVQFQLFQLIASGAVP